MSVKIERKGLIGQSRSVVKVDDEAGWSWTCPDCAALKAELTKARAERDAALAEAAMAGAAEDGAMQSANDLVQRLDEAEAQLAAANEELEYANAVIEQRNQMLSAANERAARWMAVAEELYRYPLSHASHCEWHEASRPEWSPGTVPRCTCGLIDAMQEYNFLLESERKAADLSDIDVSQYAGEPEGDNDD